MLVYSLQPLPLMLAGALAGIGSRLRPLQRLKERVNAGSKCAQP